MAANTANVSSPLVFFHYSPNVVAWFVLFPLFLAFLSLLYVVLHADLAVFILDYSLLILTLRNQSQK